MGHNSGLFINQVFRIFGYDPPRTVEVGSENDPITTCFSIFLAMALGINSNKSNTIMWEKE